MRKLKFAIIALLILAAQTQVQAIKFGIRAGTNLVNDIDLVDNNQSIDYSKLQFSGFTVGPVVEFGIPLLPLHIETGLLYSYKSYDINVAGTGIDALTAKSSTLEIPANLKLRIGIPKVVGVSLHAGPYAAYRINNSISFGDNLSAATSGDNFDFGANLGAGVLLFDKLELMFNAQYGIAKDKYVYGNYETPNIKSKLYSINATFYF